MYLPIYTALKLLQEAQIRRHYINKAESQYVNTDPKYCYATRHRVPPMSAPPHRTHFMWSHLKPSPYCLHNNTTNNNNNNNNHKLWEIILVWAAIGNPCCMMC